MGPRHLAIALAAFAFTGCDEPHVRTTASARDAIADTLPRDTVPLDTSSTITFAVASDLHFLSPRLVASIESPALASMRAGDRKMLLQGPALLHSFLDSVRVLKPTFVLVPGDLTKDGELASHEDLADSLQTLVDAGIRVVVVPGNHDVDMYPAAYTETGSVSTPGVSATTFARLYRSCGYGQARSRDSASLSYVVDVAKGLRAMALDAMAYRDNAYGAPSSSWGVLAPSTQAWLEAQLDSARADGVDVVGMIHFNMLEHFEGAATASITNGYILSDARAIAQRMAEKGLHAVFTGHFHASDIVSSQLGSSVFTDIETGSLITPPNRFRTGSIRGGIMTLRGRAIREIDYDLGDTAFTVYADSFLFRGLVARTGSYLSAYGVPSTEANTYAGVLARAWMNHYAGNEPSPIPAGIQERIDAWSTTAPAASQLLRALSTDLPPHDLEATISLR